MNIVNNKKVDSSENVFYGVNVNDKEAVKKEYQRLKRKHYYVTVLVIVVLVILLFFGLDFYRVNYLGGKPIFAIATTVENGTLFKGLGYSVLYCDDGERYTGSVLYKTCQEPDDITFGSFLYEKIIDYGIDNKTVDLDNLKQLSVISFELDEDNSEGGSDYVVDISFECNDGSSKCFKTDKEYNDPLNIKTYVRLNKYNEVYDIVSFKNSGSYYDTLVENYTEKVKNYMIDQELLNVDNLRSFNVSLVSNNGLYKFRGTTYADTYLIQINYLCSDNGNECVTAFDDKDYEGDYANLTFYATMFLDVDDNVVLVGPREYFDVD